MSARRDPVRVDMDPVRTAIETVAASDSDREVMLRQTTIRADLPLPGGKRASVEVTRNTAKISGKHR